jgi:hypothetical protein
MFGSFHTAHATASVMAAAGSTIIHLRRQSMRAYSAGFRCLNSTLISSLRSP